jgi:hypothetical protein
MSSKVLIASATTKKDETETHLFKSLEDHVEDIDLIIKTDNKKGLCQVYNEILDAEGDKYDAIIFCHDDVTIDSVNFVDRTLTGLQTYDVVGVAGGSKIKKNTPILWHLMTDKMTHSGIVFHPHHEYKEFCFPTTFGPRPKEVAVLDGVYLAVKPKTLFEKEIKFDENIKGFHHYDIKFSIDCKLAGLSLGTLDINIIHQSPGLDVYDDAFKDSEKYMKEFLNEIMT